MYISSRVAVLLCKRPGAVTADALVRYDGACVPEKRSWDVRTVQRGEVDGTGFRVYLQG